MAARMARGTPEALRKTVRGASFLALATLWVADAVDDVSVELELRSMFQYPIFALRYA